MNEQDRERIRTAIDVLDALRTGMAVVANTTGVSEVDDLALESWNAVRRAHELYEQLAGVADRQAVSA